MSACIAPPRFFRRCARPAWWRTWLLLCKPRNHSHCCTLQLHLLLLASAASEARGEGATHHRPPGASAEAPPPASARTPRPSPAASCSLPPVSASCPHCPRLQQHLVNFPKFNLMLVVKWLLCTLTVQKRFSASAMVESAWRQRWLLPSVDLYLNSDPPRWAGSEHTGQRNRIGGGAAIRHRDTARLPPVNGASVNRHQWEERKNQSNAIINSIGQDFHHKLPSHHKAFLGERAVRTIKPKMNKSGLSRSTKF